MGRTNYQEAYDELTKSGHYSGTLNEFEAEARSLGFSSTDDCIRFFEGQESLQELAEVATQYRSGGNLGRVQGRHNESIVPGVGSPGNRTGRKYISSYSRNVEDVVARRERE